MASSEPRGVAGSWVRAREQDTDLDEVYVRPDTPLPPSRMGRTGLELREDGSFRETAPGPTDAPEGGPAGSWSVDGEHLVLRGGSERGERKLRISEVTPERLSFRRT